MIEKHQSIVNGIEISYVVKHGTSSALTVIFIHGFPFNSEMWLKQLEALPKNVTGVAYDIRGFGGSSSSHHYLSIDLFAKDLLLLIKKLGHGRVVLCGVSMGGYIALRAMELANGEIAGLVLSDTNASADSNEAKLNRFASIEQILKDGLLSFAGNFMKKLFSKATMERKMNISSSIYSMIVRNSVETVCATQLALASRTETASGLNNIHVPVLVIRGAEDELTSADQALFLRENIQGAELYTIPDTGHLPNCEAPDQFNQLLNAFLQKHFLS